AARMSAMQQALNTQAVREFLEKDSGGGPITDKWVLEFSQHAFSQLEEEKVGIDAGHDREVAGMLAFAPHLVPRLAGGMDVTVLHIPIGVADRFVLSDHPVALIDPAMPEG